MYFAGEPLLGCQQSENSWSIDPFDNLSFNLFFYGVSIQFYVPGSIIMNRILCNVYGGLVVIEQSYRGAGLNLRFTK